MLRVMWAGASRDKQLAELCQRYIHRISQRTPFRCEDMGAGRGTRPGQVAAAEGRKLLARVPDHAHLITLEVNGDTLDSEAFARRLETLQAQTGGDLIFAIGGHEGLAPPVSQRANGRLSLSAMTWTHEMARVLFLEQLYRALTILRGEPYHH